MQYNALLSFLVFISSFSSLFQAHRREPLYGIEIIVKKDALTFSRSQNFFIKKYTILFKSDFQLGLYRTLMLMFFCIFVSLLRFVYTDTQENITISDKY